MMLSKFALGLIPLVLLVFFNHQILKNDFNFDDSLPDIYTNGCHLGGAEYVPKACTFGNRKSEFTIVLVGDSHAAQFFPAFEKLAIMHNFNLISLTKSSCPFAYPTLNQNCKKWNALVAARIKLIKPDFLITSNSLIKNYFENTKSELNATLWANGILYQLEKINLPVEKIFYIQDIPYPPFDTLKCIKRNLSNLRCKFPDKINILESDILFKLKSRGVNVIKIKKFFCESGTCDSLKEGFNIYRDQSHISLPMSNYLSEYFSYVLDLKSSSI